MTEGLFIAVVLVVLPIVLLLANAGCVGEDPDVTHDQGVAEGKTIGHEEGYREGHDAGQQEGKTQGLAEGQAAGKNQAIADLATEQQYPTSILKEPLLVGYWRLAEPQGSETCADSGPKKIDGEYRHTVGIKLGERGMLALIEDPNDKAAQFLGTEGYAQIPKPTGPASAALNTPEFALEVWLNPKGTSTATQVVVGAYEADATGELVRGFLLEVERPATGYPKVRARLGGGATLEADLGPGIQREGWRHVVLTYYSGIPQSARLYVNADGGTPADELDNIVYEQPTTPQYLRIGAGQSAPDVVGRYFEGSIDEVAYYDGPLTNAQVMQHYFKSF